MRSRYTMSDSEGAYFLTCTIVEWLPALVGKEVRDAIVNALQFYRVNKNLRLYAYVIMEDHLHLLAEAPDLSHVIQSFKSYTAREILHLARESGKDWLLNQFEYYRKHHKTESKHQVWQEGSHPQFIQGSRMLTQKINYIHNNPVKRGYVDLPEQWRYSSARNYVLDDESVIEIDGIGM